MHEATHPAVRVNESEIRCGRIVEKTSKYGVFVNNKRICHSFLCESPHDAEIDARTRWRCSRCGALNRPPE